MPKFLKICVAILAVLALSGTAVATPSAARLTATKVKKIAKKEIAKAAPNLSVKNAGTLGGKTAAQITPVLTTAQSSSVINVPNGGVDVVQVAFVLNAASHIAVSGVVELQGADSDERAQCLAKLDGSSISLGYETTFDDIGANNEASLAVQGQSAAVAAGAHIVTISCSQLAGVVTKDDAAVQVLGVPN